MCGIIGYTGKLEAPCVILEGLKSLEYRGYDSAGLAIAGDNGFVTVKCSGRVETLETKCKGEKLFSGCGIGHTRWATHGAPSEVNAHPHESENCVIVHNGIIENYIELKKILINDGYIFKSDTDTETIVHMLDKYYKQLSDPLESIKKTVEELKGSFAIAVMFKDRRGEIWGVKRDNPLIAAVNADGAYLASDIPALLPYSNKILRPEDNEVICINKNGIILYDVNGNAIPTSFDEVNWNVSEAQKNGYEHFMLKEIYEQPSAILRTINGLLGNEGIPDLSDIGLDNSILKKTDSISVVACGSATHAGLVGKYMIEKLAGVPVFVTTASEYRYCPPITVGNTLTIAVSQSGETADTLAALRLSKQKGNAVLGIINAVGSAIARESDYVIYTNAGAEIAVATTKGYTTQLAAFAVFAVALGLAKNRLDFESARRLCSELKMQVPKAMDSVLQDRKKIKYIAKNLYDCSDFYFIGRGADNFAAVECSLKLKEISYIHSEAYAAGELKHGTLSLIEDGTPVVALVSDERYYDKMLGNIKEVIARGGKVIVVCTDKYKYRDENSFASFIIPSLSEIFSPMVSVVFSQMLAYEIAVLRDCDVDHPRNLAKSVTVE